MIQRLLPAAVVAVDTTVEAGEDGLFPEERELIARAVAKRRAEFSTVRACARQALAELGVPPAPILPGPRRAPQWPAGVVGSMTHCTGYRAAAVARTERVVGLGIDAELDEPLPDGVLELIARPEELDHLTDLAARQPGHWDRLLFSIKESVYKTWFPLTGEWLDFAGASVRIDAAGRFRAALQVPGPLVAGREITAFDGVFAIGDGLVLTAIVVEQS